MPEIEVSVTTPVSTSIRARQLSSMFDVPAQDRHDLTWSIDAPWDDKPWNVGLIVGPSGSGKTTIAEHVFKKPTTLKWGGASVIDDFGARFGVEDIANACQTVGFNTIPAWLRPYRVLSTGEQFRVTLARMMLETPSTRPVVVDEFTSVVDRQVAKIGAHAVQKWARKSKRQFVAVTCHYDVLEWLQPDWVIDASKQTFEWRSVQPRPTVDVEIHSVGYDYWKMFAPFHYLTPELNKSARCFVAFVDGQPTTFAGILHRPHPKVKDIKGISRIVTLPDWQGLGLAFVLTDALGAVYKAAGYRLRNYPAHPSYIRAIDRSPNWYLAQRPGFGGDKGVRVNTQSLNKPIGAVGTGDMTKRATSNSKGIVHGPNAKIVSAWRHGSKPCAVFEYVGPAYEPKKDAIALLTEAHGHELR